MGKKTVVILGIIIVVVIGGMFQFFSTAKGDKIAGDFRESHL